MVSHTVRLSILFAQIEAKLRNEGSYLGIAWYILNPVLMFLLLLAVFSKKLGTGIAHYPAYLLLGIILFNFFQSSTIEASRILHKNRAFLRAAPFSSAALINSAILHTLISHIFEIALFCILALTQNIPLLQICWYVVLLPFFYTFCFGIALLLASLTVYCVDLEHIWIFTARLLWFATPIFYTLEDQYGLHLFNLFNPLYYYITIARSVMIYNTVPSGYLLFGMVLHTLFWFELGTIVHKSLKHKFAELF